MGKLNHDNDLSGPRARRSLLAITLAASLAAFGCTTNQNLGDGTPTRSGPDVRTAPTSGVTSGGETTVPPPMTSSYTRTQALPEVTPRVIRRAPDEAAAIMAQHEAARGRYLGVVSPGLSGRAYLSENIRTGAFVNPALATNPQVTVNSSISSQPTAGISSGADGTSVDAGAVLSGTTAAATIGGTTTPTAAAIGLPAGTFAATGTLPTVASSGIPTVTAASAATGRATTVAPTVSAPTVATNSAGTALGSASAPVRILRSTTGSVTVTNVQPSSTTRTSGRNQ